MANRSPTARSKGRPASARNLRAQGRRTMGKLLDAGLHLFGTKGYHATRVDDVVKRARTSHGTFYLYFENKEDLLRALAEECAIEMQELSAGLGEVTPDAAGRAELRGWVEGFWRTYSRYGAVIRVWMESPSPDTELARMGIQAMAGMATSLGERIDTARRRAGLRRRVRRTELLPMLLIAMVERFTYFVVSRGAPDDHTEEQILDELTTLVHRGFFAGP